MVGVFCLWEWKGAKLPIVPSKHILRMNLASRFDIDSWVVYIFKHVTVTGVYITMFIKYAAFEYNVDCVLMRDGSGMIFFSALYYLPQFFQVALAYSPIRSGTFLLPVLVSQTIASFGAVSNQACSTVSLPRQISVGSNHQQNRSL